MTPNILKEITIYSKNRNDVEIPIGYILYLRDITDKYSFEPNEEKGTFKGKLYPQQPQYPNDEIDNIIFDSIKQKFPKSKIKNDLDTRNNRDIPVLKTKLIINPLFTQTSKNHLNDNFHIEINIYPTSSKERFSGIYFEGSCDYEKYEIIQENLKSIKFL